MTKKRLSKLERSKLTIESPLNEIIIGLLLGDGHIQKIYNSRFMYGQSSLRIQHFNYFNHVLELFKPYLSNEFKLKKQNKNKIEFLDKRTKNTYSSISFATLTLPCFNKYRNLFYNEENKKIVPLNINQLLTPIGLAY